MPLWRLLLSRSRLAAVSRANRVETFIIIMMMARPGPVSPHTSSAGISHLAVRYLGQIFEIEHESTREVGPTLAIYRERNMGCRRGGCGEHWQRPPESIIDIRQPFPPRFRLLWGPAALDIAVQLRVQWPG